MSTCFHIDSTMMDSISKELASPTFAKNNFKKAPTQGGQYAFSNQKVKKELWGCTVMTSYLLNNLYVSEVLIQNKAWMSKYDVWTHQSSNRENYKSRFCFVFNIKIKLISNASFDYIDHYYAIQYNCCRFNDLE